MPEYSEFEVFATPITIGVVADTHIRRPGRQLPPQLLDGLRDVDLILHAGDLTSDYALGLFEALAPVRAVVGNNDSDEILERFPLLRLFRFGAFTAALIHGHGHPRKTAKQVAERALRGKVDIAIYGHSHIPHSEWIDSFLMFNPGSATDKRWQPRHSYGIIHIDEEIVPEIRYF